MSDLEGPPEARVFIFDHRKEFWPQDKGQKKLLAGPFCRKMAEKGDWDEVPYHWNDTQKLLSDCDKINSMINELTHELGAGLSKCLGLNGDFLYWKTILGSWLSHYVSSLFDRWETIEEAYSSCLNLSPQELPHEDLLPPLDFRAAVSLWLSEAYNTAIFQKIFEFRQGAHIVVDTTGLSEGTPKVSFLPERPMNSREVFLDDSMFRFFERACLAFLLGGTKYLFTRGLRRSSGLRVHQLPKRAIDWAARGSLVPRHEKADFNGLLRAMLPYCLPRSYLEDFAALRAGIWNKTKTLPGLILSSNGLWSTDYFKIWAAELRKRGAKIYGIQHGGCYGMQLRQFSLEFEVEVTEKWFSWGWTEAEVPKIKPLPSPRLRSLSIKPKRGGDLMILTGYYPPYTYSTGTVPAGARFEASVTDLGMLIKGLTEKGIKPFALRLHPDFSGWRTEGIFAELFATITVWDCKEPLLKQIKRAKAAVVTYNGTALLELIALNFPTYICWDPKLWPLNARTERHLLAFERVGLFHPTTKGLLEFLQRKQSELEEHFFSPTVQKVLIDFRAEYCQVFKWRDLAKWTEALRPRV